MYHIIPDIHGHADKLDGLLAYLGWRKMLSGWIGPTPEQRIVFLGDFIDRGPENARVLDTVRSLIDSGKACAVMGNHEFNAIHYHTVVDGKPLRERSQKNRNQHKSFLDEFPTGDARTRDAINWMKDLPLFFENDLFRAVHACWYAPAIDLLKTELSDTRLSDDDLEREGWTAGPLWDALQIVTSGVEKQLPEGYSFFDKGEHERHHVRIAWWLNGARSWRDAAQSVPDVSSLPDGNLPEDVFDYIYSDTKPVFFGHYWLTGRPRVEAPHALCLDYSAGKGGPLVAYRFEGDQKENLVDQIVAQEIS
ncbi:metallophosphoesterase [Ruegeria profundi]|uniref:Calcineurin-like phosphoesterase domain-containing protein n=1 Tax=Ruegeria profundi TaxID=1685378 RepID=A0A0X3TPV9_9RHOB|nr:metallophosphoesterase [Ruegeria profundi]KUJ77795.1 hypothetical protein AVO44_15840 [Ruegeria profundi]